ncbi:MAG: hypothetical protein ABFS18_11175 [Thermodesulfobacteriota bacterium]
MKKYVSGVVLATTSGAGLFFLLTKVIEKTLMLAEKIRNGQIQLDIAEITELLSRQTTGAEAQLLNIATAVLIISWLLAILDSYRVGYGREKH